MPTQLNVYLASSALPSGVSNPITISIPSALQSLDSGSQASQQSGFSATSELVRSIFRGGCFYSSTLNTWFSASEILYVTAS